MVCGLAPSYNWGRGVFISIYLDIVVPMGLQVKRKIEEIELDLCAHWVYNTNMATKFENRRHDTSMRVRLLPEQAHLFRKAADLVGLTLSAWVRERLIKMARKELAGTKYKS